MKDYKIRFNKLISEAAECDLIGNLAVDAAKRNSFRRLAEQYRMLAWQVKAEMDGRDPASISDREFLLRNAKEFRHLSDLSAASGQNHIKDELLRMAVECESEATEEG